MGNKENQGHGELSIERLTICLFAASPSYLLPFQRKGSLVVTSILFAQR
ncbi:UNVERIFIED_CONTAM: hypothetical protein N8J90_01810 [Halobacillus marinus]|nr:MULTISPECIES: hypothetical protein [unclassified Halobacillus]